MKSVLIAAVLALIFGTIAHAADRKTEESPAALHVNACIDLRQFWSHTEMPALETTNCCYGDTHCAQYISTSRMVRAAPRGRT
jgi:hypothetical protein